MNVVRKLPPPDTLIGGTEETRDHVNINLEESQQRSEVGKVIGSCPRGISQVFHKNSILEWVSILVCYMFIYFKYLSHLEH